MAEERHAPRGRGALLEMLKKHKEAKAGLGEPTEEQLPPKSRGRAAFLQKLKEMKEGKAGGLAEAPPSETPSSSSRPTVSTVTKSFQQLEVETLTSETTVSFAGSQGTPLPATANYIQLDVEKDRGVFEYEVRFDPDIDARSNRMRLVNEAIRELDTVKVYDGDVCLYLPMLLFDGGRREFNSKIPNTETPVTTTIIYKRKKRMGECLHLYNVLFKRIMHILLYNRIGRNYFNHDHKQIVPQHKLEILPGFAIHVDEMEGGLMICLDTQHRVIRSQTVYELFQEIQSAHPRNFKEEVIKNVITQCVLTKYNNKSYIIDDIIWDMTPRDSFETRGGTSITFIEYYKQHYNIKIQDLNQPLLINKKTVKSNDGTTEHLVCLIPELTHLTGLTDAMRNDFKVMKDVASFTRVTPNQRALALRTFLQNVRNSPEATQVLANWGLKISETTVNLTGRICKEQSILFGGGKQVKVGSGSDWNRAISENSVTGPVDIHTWQLYYTKRDSANANGFAEKLVRAAKSMGCVIRPPQHILLEDDRSECYRQKIQQNLHQDIQVAVFVCPTMRVDRYSIIKKLCCINMPVASQVILSKTLNEAPKLRTIVLKIGLQITCKLGGTLWSVAIPASDWMVCGIDVYHGLNKQSVCGFVASTNSNFTKYHSEVMFQQGEIGDFFKGAFRNALKAMKNKTGSFPAKVVIFRDGVGDGQLDHCRRYEVQQFLDVIKELNINISLTFIVVQKRISTRIYRVDRSGSYDNPPSGTVIDYGITRRALADFYLVPQSVRQGTVNPTHYIVVHNDGNIKPDHLQMLAYKLCHLYYNWSGTIRVPAPCLYAHKLASLIGQVVQKIPGPELNDRLYYL